MFDQLARVRASERAVLVAKIAARANAARFRGKSLQVLAHDPAKAREMKLGGFGANWSGDIYLALPLTDRNPPQSEKETIDITDWSGETHTYTLTIVTPLIADNCYRLSLRARNTRPARSAVPGF